MKESLQAFEEPKEQESAVLSPHDEAMLDQITLKRRIEVLQEKIKEDHSDTEQLLKIQNELAVAERDLGEAVESQAIEERNAQEARRTQHEARMQDLKKNADWDEAIRVNKNVDRVAMRNEAIADDQKFDKQKDWDQAIGVNQNIDRMADWKEAVVENEKFDEEKAFEEEKAGALRSLAYYAQGSKKIARQRDHIATITSAEQGEDVKRLRSEIAEAEKVRNEPEVLRLEAELQEAEQRDIAQERATQEAILENMEKIFPAQEADAKRFVERYWGESKEQHETAIARFAEEVGSASNIEGLLGVIESWGGIPEGAKFVTNTKFQQDLGEIFALHDEEEKIAELETITKNDTLCEKLLTLYRKEREEALTPIEEAPAGPASLAMRQPNPTLHREWVPSTDPELESLREEYEKVAFEEKEWEDLNIMVRSSTFKWLPAAFLATKKGRRGLELLRQADVPTDSRYERETSALIAVTLRLKAMREHRERLEEKLGRTIRRSAGKNQIVHGQAGTFVAPEARQEDRKPGGGFFRSLFKFGKVVPEKAGDIIIRDGSNAKGVLERYAEERRNSE